MKTAVLTPSVSSSARSKASASPYQQHTEPVDDNTLIVKFLPLVRHIVERIRINLPSHIEVEELYSVGVTGLIAAVRNFDRARGRTFAAYASVRIRGAILDELRRLDWCPRRTRAKGRKLRDAISELEQSLGREPDEKEICEKLDISLQEYHQLMDEVRPLTFVALDDSGATAESDGASLHEMIPDHSAPNVREMLDKEDLLKLVTQRIDELPDTQKKVLAMYYFEEMRLAEIAQVFGVTESRICQIHSQAILTLRSFVHRMKDK